MSKDLKSSPAGESFHRSLVDSEARGSEQVIVIEPRSALRQLGLPDVWEYRHLLWFFVLRAIRGRYRPTMLGYGWIVARPLLLCFAYVLVFGFLFKVNTDPIPFTLFVFLGIVIFLFFSGGVSDTTASLINNAGIMSKVYYPRLIVPLTSIIVNMLDLAAALLIVVIMMIFYGVTPSWQIIVAPLFLLGIVLTTLAVGVILAARTVKIRDVMQVLPIFMRVFIYSMPCVYPITLVPEKYLGWYFLNPMSAYLQGFRWAIWGEMPPPLWSLVSATIVVLVALVWGLHYFNRVERTMVDTL